MKQSKKRKPIPLRDRGLEVGVMRNGKLEFRIVAPDQLGSIFAPLPVLDKMAKQFDTDTEKRLRVRYAKLAERNRVGKGNTKTNGDKTRATVLALAQHGLAAKAITIELEEKDIRVSYRRVLEILQEHQKTRKP